MPLIWGGGAKPFSLAQSLEVAEHLYEKHASNFIKLLTSLSNIILFSAAIPYQGGTHHVNEQPPTYWAELFAKEGFVCFDILREKNWGNENIESWYKQNILLFTHKNKQEILLNQGFKPVLKPLYLIHPQMWEYKNKEIANLLHSTRHYRKLKRFIAKIPFLKTLYHKLRN
ncbi:hypothetical protein [Helicobacter sp. MIT 00-7814]|uniref:hypothetical protein n=1 Tax=Helicobacter sp. MIT 00-7814 TaxID=2040650 RepID=UPI0015F19961|nr:hypothetical protein [Helicobacter sp. MIT 00-7814]